MTTGALNLIVLPQFSGQGYRPYSPILRQYGTHMTIAALKQVSAMLACNLPGFELAIGDISFSTGGPMLPHTGHQHGREADLRPVRKDRKNLPVTVGEAAYDKEATRLVVEALRSHSNVEKILFNDTSIPGVTFYPYHYNHLHVAMKT